MQSKKLKKLDPSQSHLWIIGGGIAGMAGMAAAAFAIRDAKVPAQNIHILEELEVSGGSMDGGHNPLNPNHAWVTRGGRMLTDETYLCTWDLFSSIPSLEDPNISVREECREFNEKIKTHAQARLIDANHVIAEAEKLGLSTLNRAQMLRLLALKEERIGSRRIDEFFDDAFFQSNFWRMWRTTFAFQKWHSAAELRRYFLRFIQELPRIHTLAGVKRTKYNQYDSMIYPLQRWLVEQGVDVRFGTYVTDADFVEDEQSKERKASKLYLNLPEGTKQIVLGEHDLALFTLGSITADSRYGGQNDVPALIRDRQDHGWRLWETLAQKAPDFGRPMTFNGNIDEHKWKSFTLTLHDDVLLKRIIDYTGNEPGTGDRPLLIPENAVNFAFLGQFVELEDDVVFTVEYSVRGAMLAIYQLLGVDREVPEIYNGLLDPKVGLKALETVFH